MRIARRQQHIEVQGVSLRLGVAGEIKPLPAKAGHLNGPRSCEIRRRENEKNNAFDQ